MQPDIRLPFLSLPEWPRLVAWPPIEPGERCLRSTPCDACWPLNPCRFIVPWKPLPLLVPMTSTNLTPSSDSSPTVCPSSKPAATLSSRRVSVCTRLGLVPALASCPIIGIVELRALISPHPTCTAE